MVNGINKFSEHFSEYTACYILIGGGACDVQFGQRDIEFRRTKDLDIVLVVEVIDDSFVNHFWDFIKAGQYDIAQVDLKKCFYRFINPAVADYPVMIELFPRKPDGIPIKPGFHITDIPTGEDVSSLSAILMDDDYYNFAIANSKLVNGVHLATVGALICLKARAFLNNKKRKEEGHRVQQVDIIKHKNDVLRLATVIDPTERIEVPSIIDSDLREYISVILAEEDKTKELVKQLKIGDIRVEEIVKRIRDVFIVKGSEPPIEN